jgi:two-component system sensor histidine kinase RegB
VHPTGQKNPLNASVLAAVRPALSPLPPEQGRAIDSAWVLRLRWAAIGAQVLMVLVVVFFLAVPLQVGWVLCLIGLEVTTNLLAESHARHTRRVLPQHFAILTAVDLVLFSLLLYGTGGAFNPFTFLYLIHLALAAMLLPLRWTLGLVGLTSLLFALLFTAPPLGATDGAGASSGQHLINHLHGMWWAFTVSAAFMTYFISRIAASLRRRDRDLAAAREQVARTEHLAALASLAAGAAHELGTPRATIAVGSRELELELERRSGLEDAAEDARTIRQQVERCRSTLEELAAGAGLGAATANTPMTVAEVVALALEPIADRRRAQFTAPPALRERLLRTFPRALAQALRRVVENALDAAPEAPVEIAGRVDGESFCLEVTDHGPGMTSEELAHATEPFFTTKAPGRGSGLGLFLARTLLEGTGGSLTLKSRAGNGTRVCLQVPLALVLASEDRT